MTKQNSPVLKKIIFISLCLFLIVHVYTVFLGFYGDDDINYARLAHKWAYKGGLDLLTKDHFELRWMTIIVSGIFYRLLGVNDFATPLYCLSCILLMAYIIHRILRQESIIIYVLALSLFILNYTIIFYSHRLLPDPGVALFILLAVYVYQQVCVHDTGKQVHIFFLSLAFSVSLFAAVLTKETVIISLPLWLFLFIKDIAAKRQIKFWLLAAVQTMVFAFIYCWYFKLQTGDWLYRFHILQGNSYFNECSFDQLPVVETWKRIGYYLWQAFMQNGDLFYLLPAVTAFIYRKNVFPDGTKRNYATIFLVLLFASNFMSISITDYIPMCHSPRHFLFLMPLAAICGAYMLKAYYESPGRYWLLPVFFFIVCIVSWLSHVGETKILYTLIFLVLAGHLVLQKLGKKLPSFFFTTSLIAIMLVKPLYDFVHPKTAYYSDQQIFVVKDMPGILQTGNIYTADFLTAELSEYFLQFDSPKLTFGNLAVNHIDSLTLDGEKENIYFLLNGDYNTLLKEQVDSIIKNSLPSSPLVPVGNRNNVILFRVDDITVIKTLEQFSRTDL